MKAVLKLLPLSIALIVLFIQCEKNNSINIRDKAFLDALIEQGVDTDGNGQISNAEAEAVNSLDVGRKGISNLTGIESFVNLKNLNCGDNQLTSLDVSNNTALAELYCYINQLTILDVSNNTLLRKLWCSENDISSQDVSDNVALTNLDCSNNQITSLDVSNNTALAGLICSGNHLISLDVSNNPELEYLYCYDNQLTRLDFSNNNTLTYLDCSYNQLTSLDVSNNAALTNLLCSFNQLKSLDISNNTSLGLAPPKIPPECYLAIGYMPSLEKVCVWELPFPPTDFLLCIDGSPNVYFTTECSK